MTPAVKKAKAALASLTLRKGVRGDSSGSELLRLLGLFGVLGFVRVAMGYPSSK